MKAKDIRKGKVIDYKGAPHVVMEFQHRTPGNLRAFVQARLRNIMTGNQCEERFSSTEDIPEADVYTFNTTFLYSDDNGYHFMNSETYDQIELSKEIIGDNAYYLQENMTVQMSTYNDVPINVEIPKTVILTIVETQPELKGATANNSPKPAITDTGLSINVPGFMKVGDRVVVDTETGSYLSRSE